ncbi:hypothetical protein CcI49_15960 [Frankia sp. CcI49]|uniref:hypothetical protein n=1 Tax=unclassified Frankia TaxID=2632575 RepID=UPI0006CA4CB2|nr:MULTISPECIES: hypothetical protein [unclassified Frankia]KPM51289.1 hypothetical protein ACG83_34675 [Frankia sp. R43]ONH59477.1 hypothetical protein CcI49_15960 [Frankia sp. CcI49]
MKLRWRKSKPATSPAYGGRAFEVDDDLEDDLDELGSGLGDAGAAGPAPAAGGPVMLTLTTRSEIEQAAERAANPQPVRRRMERGMFGGAATGHSHGGDSGGSCGSGGCGC